MGKKKRKKSLTGWTGKHWREGLKLIGYFAFIKKGFTTSFGHNIKVKITIEEL